MIEWLELGQWGPTVVVAVLLAATMVWVLVWLPLRRARRHWVAILEQVAGVLLSLVLTLLLVALAMNRVNDWYPTWRSLTSPATVEHVQTVGRPLAPAPGQAGWVTGTPTAVQAHPTTNPALGKQDWTDVAQGKYLVTTVVGTVSHVVGHVLVWLPPSYLGHPERFYPVVLGFSGVPGRFLAYRDNLHVGETLSMLSAEHAMRESIVVVPDVFPNNLDTECVDSVDGSIATETWVVDDVSHWITTNLRAVDDPQAWATTGYSAGGWCSSMLTMRHPERYRWSVSMSGYFQPLFAQTRYRPADDPAYDLGLIARRDAPPVRLWFWTARDDRMPYRQWSGFVGHVRNPTSLTTTLLGGGGHSWPLWTAGFPAGMMWLGEQSSQFGWVQA